MSISGRILLGVAAALLAAPQLARAAALSVVAVTAPDVLCVFDTTCKVTAKDSVGDIAFPALSGKAFLQSRTFVGASGAPAEGKTGYEYRVDMTQATALGDSACITDVTIDFGPVAKFQYDKSGPLDDVNVVTKGGLGSIKVASADQTGTLVTFVFEQPVCAGDASSKGASSDFFGLASTGPPTATTAMVSSPGFGPIKVDARAPMH